MSLAMSPDELIVALQKAYSDASHQHPTDAPHIRRKWKFVADYLLEGKQSEHSEVHHLAVELHAVFLQEGHRTVIENRAGYDPVLIGWHGVAAWVIEQQGIKPSKPVPVSGAAKTEKPPGL